MSHAGLPDPHQTSNPGFSISMTRMSLTSAVNRRRILLLPASPIEPQNRQSHDYRYSTELILDLGGYPRLPKAEQ